MTAVRVLVIDDQAVVRLGLRALLATAPGLELVGEATDAASAAACACACDVAVVGDVNADGAETVAQVRRDRPGSVVLSFTTRDADAHVRQLLAAGAAGCVLKRAPTEELIRAIRAVAAGGTYLDLAVAAGADGANGTHPPESEVELSTREGEVMRLIALGYSNKEIAARLNLSVKTVETYKTRSMEKLGLRGRVGIIRYAVQRRWLDG